MAKGHTNKPLLMAIDQRIAHWPEWQALAEQGHTIHVLALEHDAVFGLNCWRMPEELRGDLGMALKAARKARYGTPSNAPDEPEEAP